MTDSESRIQQDCFRWFWNTYCLPTSWKIQGHREIIYHIPNEGKDNGKLISVGLYPGASDLVFTWKGKHIYYELKDHKGTQSPSQKKFEAHLVDIGYEYYLSRSLKEFKELIDKLSCL